MARLSPDELKKKYADYRKRTGQGRENVDTEESKKQRKKLSRSRSSSGNSNNKSSVVVAVDPSDPSRTTRVDDQLTSEQESRVRKATKRSGRLTTVVDNTGRVSAIRTKSKQRSQSPSNNRTTSSSSRSSRNMSVAPLPERMSVAPTPKNFIKRLDPRIASATTPGQKTTVTRPTKLPFIGEFQSEPQVLKQSSESKAVTFKNARIGDSIINFGSRQEQLSSRSSSGFEQAGRGLLAVGAGFTGEIVRGAEFVRDLITKPGPTSRAAVSSVQSIARNPRAAGYKFGKNIKKNPSLAIGQVSGDLVGGFGADSVVRRSGQLVRNTAVRALTTERPATDFFDSKALNKEVKFPTASSTQEIEKLFKDANYEFVTASPQPIGGGRSELVGRGLAGSEAGGLSVTPVGRGSSEFLRVEAPTGNDIRFSINPFSSVARPTATVGKARGITRTPPSVTSQPGFEAENIFMSEQVAGTGNLVIPKRIQIGQGDIPAQDFRPLVRESADDAGILGPIQREKGTSEIEGKVPLKQEFSRVSEGNVFQRIAGFRERVEVDGVPVPIRRIDLTVNKRLDDFAGDFRGRDVVSAKEIARSSSRRLREPGSVTPTRLSSLGSSSGTSSRFNVSSGSSSSSSPVSSSSSFSSGSSSSSSPVSSSSSFSSGSSSSSSPVSSSSSFSSGSTSLSSSISRSSLGTSSSILGSSIAPKKTTTRTRIRPTDNKKQKNFFGVFVRRSGEFSQVGRATSAREAFSIGSSKVGSTAAASFKVQNIRTGRTVQAPSIGKNFRLSDREKGVVIERKEKRIKSRGELQEITFKGIKSLRRNKI